MARSINNVNPTNLGEANETLDVVCSGVSSWTPLPVVQELLWPEAPLEYDRSNGNAVASKKDAEHLIVDLETQSHTTTASKIDHDGEAMPLSYNSLGTANTSSLNSGTGSL